MWIDVVQSRVVLRQQLDVGQNLNNERRMDVERLCLPVTSYDQQYNSRVSYHIAAHMECYTQISVI